MARQHPFWNYFVWWFDSLKHLGCTPRAIIKVDNTHEIMFSVAVSGFTVSRLATSDTILNSVLDILYARI